MHRWSIASDAKIPLPLLVLFFSLKKHGCWFAI
jgi:hypothetical protein